MTIFINKTIILQKIKQLILKNHRYALQLIKKTVRNRNMIQTMDYKEGIVKLQMGNTVI
jgi:hypothetical protein